MDQSLNSLYRKRMNQWFKEIGRYSRFILNDHFSIILFVILGFGIFFYYKQLTVLQSFVQNIWIREMIKGLLSLFIISLLFIGRPIWFTQAADEAFLFSRGQDWHRYWLKGTLYTGMIHSVLLGIVCLLLTPLFQVITNWSLQEMSLFTLWVVLLRISYEALRYGMIFYTKGRLIGKMIFFMIHSLLAYVGMQLEIRGLVVLIFGYCLLLAGITGGIKRGIPSKILDFNYVLTNEEKRRTNFYRFISIFADTPHQRESVKPRIWFTPLLEKLTWFNRSTLSYLYLRLFLRNTTYSNLWLRLLLFTSVLMVISQESLLIIILGSLCLILTGLQLMPLMKEYRYHPGLLLSFKEGKIRLRSFQSVLILALLLQSALFTVILMIKLPWSWLFVIGVLGWIGISFLLTYVYAGYWLRKHS